MLLASGDVRLIRVWDVQREMKVQVYLRVYSAYLCHNYMENVTRGFVRLGEGSCRSVKYVMLCAIWYRTYDLKNLKYTHGRVLLLVTLQKPGTLLKVTFRNRCFSRFLNCTNSTKQLQSITMFVQVQKIMTTSSLCLPCSYVIVC